MDMPTYRFVGDLLDDEFENDLVFPSDVEAFKAAQRSLVEIARDELTDGQRLEMQMDVEATGRGAIYRAKLVLTGERLEATEPT